jgi:hypothetical protein
MATNLSKEDIARLESKAVDEIAAFLFEDEHVQTYIDTMIEEAGIDVSEAVTEQEAEVYYQMQSNLQIKLLAKLIGIL